MDNPVDDNYSPARSALVDGQAPQLERLLLTKFISDSVELIGNRYEDFNAGEVVSEIYFSVLNRSYGKIPISW